MVILSCKMGRGFPKADEEETLAKSQNWTWIHQGEQILFSLLVFPSNLPFSLK